MSQNQDRLAQFRKMAQDDPDNELGHYRLGQLLLEEKQYADAITSFKRTLEIEPRFSKVYQLLGQALLQIDQRDEAIQTLRTGFGVADERGDNMPRDEMGRMLRELGEPEPVTLRVSKPQTVAPLPNAFCQRSRCDIEKRAVSQQLASPPFRDETGKKIYEQVCAGCWNEWVRVVSVKLINELRLDLSSEHGQAEYDRYMNEYLGLE